MKNTALTTLEPLTVRETQVLALLTDGLTNAKIARRLKISPHTTKFHVRNVCFKLGVSNRTSAVVVACRRGLVSVEVGVS